MTFTPKRILDVGETTIPSAHEFDEDEPKKKRKPRSARRAIGELAVERMGACGKAWIAALDAHTGLDYFHTWYCERKSCAICAQRRGYELQRRVATLLNRGLPVHYVYLPRAASFALRREWHNKNAYLNIPQLDGRDLLIFQHTDLVPDAQLLDKAFVNNSNWTQIQLTPDEVNISGKLGQATVSKQITKETSDGAVYSPQVFIAPEEQGPRARDIRGAIQYAKACTVDAMPRTIKEVQATLDHWSRVLTTRLTEQGITFEIKQIRSLVSVARIDWSQHVLTNATELMQQDIATEIGFDALVHRQDEFKYQLIPITQQTIAKFDT